MPRTRRNPNLRKLSRGALSEAKARELAGIRAEQEFILKRLEWIGKWRIPPPEVKKLDLGRGAEIENSPFHFQYTLTRINRRHEDSRALLANDYGYWYRAGLKNVARVNEILRKRSRK